MVDFFVKSNVDIDFQDLMPHRIHEILLVASPYDAFILEEDGHLTEQILTEYIGMNFTYAPRVNRVSTGQEAMKLMREKKFDLVIVMLRIEDQDPISLGKTIKANYPKKPVVLLAFDETELKQLPSVISAKSINRTFIWSGDASVFPAIIKYIEDRKNAKQDILDRDVRCILVVEDSPRMYSILLPLLYKEIMYQTKNLINRRLSQSKKLLLLRARPKVLLTQNYETAKLFFNRYRNNILGIISDVEFLKNKKKTKDAGFKLVKWVRNIDQSIPILIQSSQEKNRIPAKAMGTDFLHKESPTFLKKLRDFMNYNFGFGDFLFRLPDNTQVQKAKTINEFIKGIESIPDNSIVHHAKSHHFSNWLAARAEFNLASMIRSISVDDFDNGESIRNYILKYLKNNKKDNKSTIINYSSSRFNSAESDFFRLSSGSLGGKARGLGFAKSMINYSNIKNKFSNFKIFVPKSAVIGTNEFDRFMKDNELWDIALSNISDTKLQNYFLKSRISIDLTLKLESFVNENNFPIAVRSSSLLEDSQYQPLAGTYETIMLCNNSKSNKDRLNKLIEAIKLIYASTFKGEARTLLKNTAHRIEEEKMAILIQEVVGVKYKSNRFYPTFSGVLQSINYYPVSYMKRSEGVAYLALGFGRTIADGEKCLRLSPKYPKILPQFFSLKSTMQSSQNEFYAMNFNLNQQNNHQLNKYTLEDAETDGALKWVGSSISKEDGTIKDSLLYPGTRIVSFSPILKWGNISFDKLALEILSIGKKALGCPVEIEFAVNIKKDSTPEFYLLQIKPMVLTGLHRANTIRSFDKNSILCKSSFSLGDGKISTLKDLIIVRPNTFDLSKSKEIAKELSKINSKFKKGRQYILCGPGRWGSTDPWLGIPVQWQSISNSKVIIEMGLKELPIDPSFGSHFFQNITNLHISYFTIDYKQKNDILNLDYLKDFEIKYSGKYIDWYSFENPFNVVVDGSNGLGIIEKPNTSKTQEVMDEEESSGI
ncbi:MAG: PEP/pyruvate-binding domain-containing protein [Candidatus Neomarinimicrobiota bacterium]